MEEERTKLSPLDSGDGAIENYRKRQRDDGACSICLDYFTDQVTLNCGHHFCRTCITKSWGVLPMDTICPQCAGIIQTKKLRPNNQLANIVEITQNMSNLLKHGSESSMEEADQEFAKDQIDCSLEILRKERENISVYKTENETESQDLLIKMEEEKEKTAAVFRKHHQFLEEQEMLLMGQMEVVKKEIALRRDENLARLSGVHSYLDRLIWEIEEKHQQSANELKNIGNILTRESSKNPGAFPAVLKWKIHNFCDFNPFLEGIMKQFKDSLLTGLQSKEAKVTLDSVLAHPQHIVSEDCKTVRWEFRPQDEWDDECQDDLEGFEQLPIVMGQEEFTTGRHFWDVDVGREEEWAVGVAEAAVCLDENLKISPEEGIWDLGKWDGKYRISVPQDDAPLSLNQELKRIRVTLNCEGGRVAFFDADSGAQLYVYSDVSFNGTALQPYFFVSGGGHLSLCP